MSLSIHKFTYPGLDVTRIRSGRLRQNAYVVRRHAFDDVLIIDPGACGAELLDVLNQFEIPPTDIFLTHAHYDHLVSLCEILDKFDIPVWMHPAEKKLLKYAPLYALRFEGLDIKVPEDFRAIEGNENALLVRGIKVLHTPGHTAGGVSFDLQGACFTGDTLMRERAGNVDPIVGDAASLRRSIDVIIGSIGDECVLLSGHGDAWTGFEAKTWLTLNRDKIEFC